MSDVPQIVIGNVAGHRFHGQADIEVVRHCKRGKHSGYYHVRKRLANGAAFEYERQLGWEIDRWFTWSENR